MFTLQHHKTPLSQISQYTCNTIYFFIVNIYESKFFSKRHSWYGKSSWPNLKTCPFWFRPYCIKCGQKLVFQLKSCIKHRPCGVCFYVTLVPLEFCTDTFYSDRHIVIFVEQSAVRAACHCTRVTAAWWRVSSRQEGAIGLRANLNFNVYNLRYLPFWVQVLVVIGIGCFGK